MMLDIKNEQKWPLTTQKSFLSQTGSCSQGSFHLYAQVATRDYRFPNTGSAYPDSVLFAEWGFILPDSVLLAETGIFYCLLPKLDSFFSPLL